jgi:hypothetical protein
VTLESIGFHLPLPSLSFRIPLSSRRVSFLRLPLWPSSVERLRQLQLPLSVFDQELLLGNSAARHQSRRRPQTSLEQLRFEQKWLRFQTLFAFVGKVMNLTSTFDVDFCSLDERRVKRLGSAIAPPVVRGWIAALHRWQH